NGITLQMVSVPSGRFLMGTSPSEVDIVEREYMRYGVSEEDAKKYVGWEIPQHQVTVQPFFMGKYEVTQAKWRAVARLTKVKIDLKYNPSYFKGDNLPVEQVSWEDAKEFCDRLARVTGKAYRLPSEAEWEYACRSGTTTSFSFGETITPNV